MRLSAKILKNISNINAWEYTSSAFIQEGQANDIYIQLVDLNRSVSPEKSSAFPEHPIRYISQATAVVVTAIFDSVDDALEFEIIGTQPFADDGSIFKFTLTSAQTPSAGNLKIEISEDAAIKTFIVKGAISIDYLNIGSC